jgi:molecular chaperone GrpE
MSRSHKHIDPPPAAPEPGGEGESRDADVPVPATSAPAAASEMAEARDRWLRAEAELQNVRRRAAREIDEGRRAAEEAGYRDVTELLDDLERAIAAAGEQGAEAAWLQGVDLVAQRMRELLARAGVVRIEAVGQPFDPHQHEALMETPAPEGVAPGTVVHEIRAGYRRGDRVLRPARVAVAADPHSAPHESDG